MAYAVRRLASFDLRRSRNHRKNRSNLPIAISPQKNQCPQARVRGQAKAVTAPVLIYLDGQTADGGERD